MMTGSVKSGTQNSNQGVHVFKGENRRTTHHGKTFSRAQQEDFVKIHSKVTLTQPITNVLSKYCSSFIKFRIRATTHSGRKG